VSSHAAFLLCWHSTKREADDSARETISGSATFGYLPHRDALPISKEKNYRIIRDVPHFDKSLYGFQKKISNQGFPPGPGLHTSTSSRRCWSSNRPGYVLIILRLPTHLFRFSMVDYPKCPKCTEKCVADITCPKCAQNCLMKTSHILFQCEEYGTLWKKHLCRENVLLPQSSRVIWRWNDHCFNILETTKLITWRSVSIVRITFTKRVGKRLKASYRRKSKRTCRSLAAGSSKMRNIEQFY